MKRHVLKYFSLILVLASAQASAMTCRSRVSRPKSILVMTKTTNSLVQIITAEGQTLTSNYSEISTAMIDVITNKSFAVVVDRLPVNKNQLNRLRSYLNGGEIKTNRSLRIVDSKAVEDMMDQIHSERLGPVRTVKDPYGFYDESFGRTPPEYIRFDE